MRPPALAVLMPDREGANTAVRLSSWDAEQRSAGAS
jgi:hypothetical protein